MTCPHCGRAFHEEPGEEVRLQAPGNSTLSWYARRTTCPACDKDIIFISSVENDPERWDLESDDPPHGIEWSVAYPRATARPVPPEVPKELADLFQEASLVLADSPKASAAFGRRCLQDLLREHLGIKKRNLDDEIQELIDSKRLPTQIADEVDAIRTVGNFASHPIKSQETGVVTDVEPGEAEWTLDVLDGLFDAVFVAAARAKERREALNKKLAEAGKPPLKKSP
jgi:hypothetical protein